LNWLDIVLGAVLLFSGIAALRNGLTREIVRLVALAVGVIGALWFYDALAVELTFIESPALAKFAASSGSCSAQCWLAPWWPGSWTSFGA
jgi:uncharacterized membrane protein required for colicin V production